VQYAEDNWFFGALCSLVLFGVCGVKKVLSGPKLCPIVDFFKMGVFKKGVWRFFPYLID